MEKSRGPSGHNQRPGSPLCRVRVTMVLRGPARGQKVRACEGRVSLTNTWLSGQLDANRMRVDTGLFNAAAQGGGFSRACQFDLARRSCPRRRTRHG
jgi:hypothetical protein